MVEEESYFLLQWLLLLRLQQLNYGVEMLQQLDDGLQLLVPNCCDVLVDAQEKNQPLRYLEEVYRLQISVLLQNSGC